MDDQTLSYYNTSRDTSQVLTCEFVFLGKIYAENVSIFIEQPTVQRFTGTKAEIYTNLAKPVGVRRLRLDDLAHPRPSDPEVLIFGGPEGMDIQPGITFRADVTAPNGLIALTQLIRTDIVRFNTEPSSNKSSNNQFVLDGETEYKNQSFPVSQTLYNEDSPLSELRDAENGIVRTDSFQTYLMYKPEGDSIWVSLSLLEWGWTGSAIISETGAWSGGGSARGGGDGRETDTLPEWKNNFLYLPEEEVLQ